jgi:hypothetical protein
MPLWSPWFEDHPVAKFVLPGPVRRSLSSRSALHGPVHYFAAGLTCLVFTGLGRKSRHRAELHVEGLLRNRARTLFNLCLRHQSPQTRQSVIRRVAHARNQLEGFPRCGAHQPGWAGDGYHLKEWETLPCQVCRRIVRIPGIRNTPTKVCRDATRRLAATSRSTPPSDRNVV